MALKNWLRLFEALIVLLVGLVAHINGWGLVIYVLGTVALIIVAEERGRLLAVKERQGKW